MIADWASIWTLLIEFETIYYNKGNGDEKCAISFRNYVLNEMGMKTVVDIVEIKSIGKIDWI